MEDEQHYKQFAIVRVAGVGRRSMALAVRLCFPAQAGDECGAINAPPIDIA